MSNPAFDSAKSAASQGLSLLAHGAQTTAEWAVANPKQAAVAGTGAALVTAPMLFAAPMLGLAGFGASGVAAGSIAAGIQSGIGSVVGPSLFATLQSAAAGGYGVAAVSTAVQGLGVAVASSAGVKSILDMTKHDENTEEEGREVQAAPPSNTDEDDESHNSSAKL